MIISRLTKLNFAVAAALLAGCALAQGAGIRTGEGSTGDPGGGSDAGTGIFETFINKAGGFGGEHCGCPYSGRQQESGRN